MADDVDVDWGDEFPTSPPAPSASAIALGQWLAEGDSDAKEMEDLVRAYEAMTTEQRVILMAICREFLKRV